MSAPVLAYENLGLVQGNGWLFRNLDLFIGARDRLALIGRNGAGKTTLLKCLADLIETDEGRRTIQPGTKPVAIACVPFCRRSNVCDAPSPARPSGSPSRVYGNEAADPAGSVRCAMVIDPRAMFVTVHVTSAPAATSNVTLVPSTDVATGSLPVTQLAVPKSQPGGSSCVKVYEPGTSRFQVALPVPPDVTTA